MEWISVKDRVPAKMISAIVCNARGWMYEAKATYHPEYGTWVLYDPQYYNSLTLDVTHWAEIPESPREEYIGRV